MWIFKLVYLSGHKNKENQVLSPIWLKSLLSLKSETRGAHLLQSHSLPLIWIQRLCLPLLSTQVSTGHWVFFCLWFCNTQLATGLFLLCTSKSSYCLTHKSNKCSASSSPSDRTLLCHTSFKWAGKRGRLSLRQQEILCLGRVEIFEKKKKKGFHLGRRSGGVYLCYSIIEWHQKKNTCQSLSLVKRRSAAGWGLSHVCGRVNLTSGVWSTFISFSPPKLTFHKSNAPVLHNTQSATSA